MTCKHILLPLDLAHGTTDALLHFQRLAQEGPVSATLLYVVELNIAPVDARLHSELRREAQDSLAKLASLFLGHPEAARLRVREGRPTEQIIAEAAEGRADLILLSSPRPGGWLRLFRSRTAERVAQYAPCPTLSLPHAWAGAGTGLQLVPSPNAAKAPRRSAPLPRPTWTSWAGA